MGKGEFRPLVKLPFLTVHMGDLPVVAVSFIAGFIVAQQIMKKNIKY